MNTADLLARSLAELQQDKGSLDEFLAQHPANRRELEPLLRLALRLEALRDEPDALPSSAARARMRARVMDDLLAEGEASPAQPAYRNGYHAAAGSLLAFPTQSRSRWFDLGRRAAAIAAAFALLIGTAGVGTVSAARDSLPGDLLYSVKTAAEQAQVALTFSDAERATVYMALAERRLWELSRAAETGKTEAASQIAEAYDRHLAGAASFATRAAIEGKSPLSASQVEDQVARQQQALQELVKRAPEPVQDAVAVALGAANQAASQLSQTVKAPPRQASPPVSASAEPMAPLGGPNSAGGGILSGPTATGGGPGLPIDKGAETPAPIGGKGILPVAPQPPVPTHSGDGAAPVAPVAASDGGVAAPSATQAPEPSPSPAPAASATATPSSAAAPEKTPAFSTPPAPAGTATPAKDGGLNQSTLRPP